MKKNFLKFIVTALVCCCLCSIFAACEKSEKVTKQEIYTGNLEISSDRIIPVELIIDENNIFTLTSTNGESLPLGFWGFPKDGLGGRCKKSGNNYTFIILDGEEIATATLNDSELYIEYSNFDFNLQKSEKSFNLEDAHGAYKGYVYDGSPFELCFVLRPENRWYIIEEDGDINDYGTYKIEGNLLTLTANGESTTYAFGTVNGSNISLNLDDEIINFQKV